MSAPRDIDPHTPGPGDEEHDPTGVRALLASLPDPGPMPPELIHRISESLAAEQNGRVHADTATDRYAGVTHPGSTPSADGASSGASPEDARGGSGIQDVGPGDREGRDEGGGRVEGGTVHPFPASWARRQGASPLRRLPAIAIAASVAVLAGAVVLGVLATRTGLGSDSLDAAVQATMSGADAGSRDDGAAGGATEEASGPTAESEAAEGTPLTSPQDGDAAAMVAPSVAFLSSGAIVTSANLAGHAKAMRDGSIGVVDEASQAVMSDSPVGSPEGAADCIGDLLDRPVAEMAGLLMAVDFVRHDGSDAALILVRDPLEASPGSGPTGDATGSGEASTAYLVPVDCGAGRAWTLQGPVRVDF
ncbi:MAG: hypothetical protein WCA30_05145 [Dermatophilaceae bacterium]